MIYNHQKLSEELIENAAISPDDICDYSFYPLRDVIDRYFQFCQGYLSHECEIYDIQPARVFVRSHTSVNASAYSNRHGYNIIAINAVTIITLYNFFNDKTDVFNCKALAEFKVLHQTLDLNRLLFDLCTQFIFFHELAHLIQKPHLNMWFDETYNNSSSYSLEHHLYEYDADIYAANNVVFLIIEYWKTQVKVPRSQENLYLLLTTGLAGIFSYLVYLMESYQDIYYKSSKHPHLMVRICYILDCFIRVTQCNFPNKCTIDSHTILSNAYKISDVFFGYEGKDLVKRFDMSFNKENSKIKSYINEDLEPKSKAMDNLVMNRF
jgi:hypothetical protein